MFFKQTWVGKDGGTFQVRKFRTMVVDAEENWSVALDLQILWKTCSAVIRGSGAYRRALSLPFRDLSPSPHL